MRKWLSVIVGIGMTIVIVGCGHGDNTGHASHAASHNATYKDGTYTAKSDSDLLGAVGEVKLTIQNGKITQADYKSIQKDGTVKDINYGKTNGKIENKDFYNKAQQAVKGANTYGPKLVETQDVDKIDSVTGATFSYKQFQEAVHKALAQAQ